MSEDYFCNRRESRGISGFDKEIQDDGHIIGNHSYTHVNLGILSKKDACEQIRKTNDAIYQITGEYPQFCVLLSEAPRRIWTVR